MIFETPSYPLPENWINDMEQSIREQVEEITSNLPTPGGILLPEDIITIPDCSKGPC